MQCPHESLCPKKGQEGHCSKASFKSASGRQIFTGTLTSGLPQDSILHSLLESPRLYVLLSHRHKLVLCPPRDEHSTDHISTHCHTQIRSYSLVECMQILVPTAQAHRVRICSVTRRQNHILDTGSFLFLFKTVSHQFFMFGLQYLLNSLLISLLVHGLLYA